MAIPERAAARESILPSWDGAPIRPTVVQIDLAAIRENFLQLKAFAGPAELLPIVKADAYGHGAVPCARILEKAGARFFGVALTEEGIELRRAGILARIVVLGGAYGERWDLLVAEDLTPLVFRKEHLEGLAAAARAQGKPAVAHLKVDTGMGRVGIAPGEVGEFVEAARSHGVRLEGVATHFANADLADSELTERQIRLMDEVVNTLAAHGVRPRVHLANSAATVTRPETHGSLVRPGIMLYGAYPSETYRDRIRLRPALRWSTRITHLKRVPVGTPISYGSRWVAKRPSVIATLPVGYADGYPRSLTNVGQVLVRGRRVPITGTVCMDQCMIDVTDVADLSVGEEVVLLGGQGEAEIRADELASWAGTIHYEIFCGIGPRVPRVFLGA
jgi:alanine racemase